MGNSNKNSQNKALANQKKTATKDRAVAAALAVVALIMVTVLVVSLLSSNGVFIRSEAAVSTKNVTVDSAMMNFFYNNYLSTWYANYSSYISAGYFSINPTVSLKTQNYGTGYEIYFLGSYTGTWYNYFLDAVMAEVETYVIYAEGAIAAGLSLNDEDYAEIDTLVNGIKASLKENKASFSDWYGKGVKEKDVRRAYELVFLAEKFMEHKQAELEAVLEADDSAIDKYVDEHKDKFYTADVLKYTITTKSNSFANDAAFDAAKAEALSAANKIAGAANHAEFINLIKEYEASKKVTSSTTTTTAAPTTETTEAAATETTEAAATETTEGVAPVAEVEETTAATTEATTAETTTTEATTAADKTETEINKYKTTITYNVSDDLGKWLFDSKTVVNNTKVIEATAEKEETVKGETKADGTKTEDKKVPYTEHTVTVYMVFEVMHLDKDLTKNGGYFISSDKALATSFLEGIKGEVKSFEDFQKAAEDFYNEYHEGHDHSDTSIVEHTIMFEGFEELQDGYFPDSYSVLGNWIDAEGREANTYSDIYPIAIDSKTTYYGFGYFEKYGEETWYVNGYAYTLDDQFQAWVADQKKVTPITSNQKALTGSITPLMYGTTTTVDDGHNH